jgi:hypothetical protein
MSQVLLFLFFSGSFVLPGIYTTRRRRRRRRRRKSEEKILEGKIRRKKKKKETNPRAMAARVLKAKGGK